MIMMYRYIANNHTDILRYISELALCVSKSDTIDVSSKIGSVFFSTLVVASKILRQFL